MLCKVIDGGKAGMNALLFGVPQQTNHLINNNVSASSLLGVSSNFTNSVATMNDTYFSDKAINLAKTIIADSGSLYNNDNNIQYVDYHNVNNRMRGVITSHPDVIRLNNLGVLDGYSDVSPDYTLGDLLNSGKVSVEDDMFTYTTYSSTEYVDITPTEIEVMDDVWKQVSKMLRDGVDPTSEDMSPI